MVFIAAFWNTCACKINKSVQMMSIRDIFFQSSIREDVGVCVCVGDGDS